MARQDRKDKPRVSIGAKLVATCCLLQVSTVWLRWTFMQTRFKVSSIFRWIICMHQQYSSPILNPWKLEDLVIATPDVGGSKRASTFSKYLGVPLVLCNKTREKANVVATMQIIGDVKDKNVVLVDDIVDTAGTITKLPTSCWKQEPNLSVPLPATA